MHRVYGPNYNTFIAYSIENQSNKNLYIKNGTFVDFYQDLSNPSSVTIASAIMMASSEINITLKEYVLLNCLYNKKNINININIFIFFYSNFYLIKIIVVSLKILFFIAQCNQTI